MYRIIWLDFWHFQPITAVSRIESKHVSIASRNILIFSMGVLPFILRKTITWGDVKCQGCMWQNTFVLTRQISICDFASCKRREFPITVAEGIEDGHHKAQMDLWLFSQSSPRRSEGIEESRRPKGRSNMRWGKSFTRSKLFRVRGECE